MPETVGANPAAPRVVVVEDHAMFRELFGKICASELGCALAGSFCTGAAALAALPALSADVVILDLFLPDTDGIALAVEIRRRFPAVRLVLISSHCDQNTMFRVAQSGAHAFVDKGTDSLATLRDALAAVLAGRQFWSARFLAARRAWERDPHSPFKLLSDWERRVLELIARGQSDREVAAKLGLSPQTVKKHRSNILRRLDLKGTPKLIAYACSFGLARLDAPDPAP